MDNQFAIFERGAKGLNVENDIAFPEAYVIPMDAGLQQDPLEAAGMIRHLLNNKVIVQQADAAFTADGIKYPAGTYVVPMKQSLRGLANTMLWKGEDISDKASAMYDISCYSFPALCGFDAAAVSGGFTASLSDVTAAPVLKGTLENGTAKYYIMPVENNQAYKAANSLVKDGVAVYRTSEDNGIYAPGSFVIPGKQGIAAKLEKLTAENAVSIKGIEAVKGKLQPVKILKTAVVGNDGGAVTAMKALGFDVTAIPYYSLNHGYDLEKHGFEALVLTGTQSFWDDSYEATGITWSLDEVGQNEVIDFAKSHDFVAAGFAGAKLNEAAGRLDVEFLFTGTEEDGQTAENGICLMDEKGSDPITYSYGAGETVFAYAPVWFTNIGKQVVASSSFAGKGFYLSGFWQDPETAAGAVSILHDNSRDYDAVLLGIDPTFRCYTPETYGIMANSLYYLGYDE